MSPRAKTLVTYMIRMILIFTIYIALIFTINVIHAHYELSEQASIALSLLPAIPAIGVLWAMLSFFRTQDEVMQRIVTESAMIASGIVGVGTFTLGFMEYVVKLPDNILIWILPAMLMMFGMVFPFVMRRYA